MAKALIIFGSTGGSTAFISQFVQSGLESSGYEVTRKDVRKASVDEIKNFDLVVLGCSTWDMGKLQGQLQIDMRPFVEQLKQYDFKGQPVAVFGLGHYSYTFTCNAANILTEVVRASNGKLVAETFKIDDVADLFSDKIEEWAKGIQL